MDLQAHSMRGNPVFPRIPEQAEENGKGIYPETLKTTHQHCQQHLLSPGAPSGWEEAQQPVHDHGI